MCNDYEQIIAWEAYCEAMRAIDLGIAPDQGELDLAPRPHVRISELTAAIVLDDEDGTRLAQMRFSFPPERPGAPVFNVRSEGRNYSESLRCIVPASAFFEFTASADKKAKRKDRWRFTRADGEWMALPALWKFGKGNQPPGLALPTVDPGPDIADIHKRQIVVLDRAHWRGWLATGDKAGFEPSPAGTFSRSVERAA